MYALYGRQSRMLLSYQGRTLYHDNRGELEFLFPDAKVVPVTNAELASACSPLQPMHISQHPQMFSIRWPLQREDFR